MSKRAKEATKLQSTSVCPGTDPAPKAQGRWIAAARERVATIQVQAHSYSVQHNSVDECERHTTDHSFATTSSIGVSAFRSSWPSSKRWYQSWWYWQFLANPQRYQRYQKERWERLKRSMPLAPRRHLPLQNNRSFQEATVKAAPNSVNI
jgi:hypothetical protein